MSKLLYSFYYSIFCSFVAINWVDSKYKVKIGKIPRQLNRSDLKLAGAWSNSCKIDENKKKLVLYFLNRSLNQNREKKTEFKSSKQIGHPPESTILFELELLSFKQPNFFG